MAPVGSDVAREGQGEAKFTLMGNKLDQPWPPLWKCSVQKGFNKRENISTFILQHKMGNVCKELDFVFEEFCGGLEKKVLKMTVHSDKF